MNIQAGHFSARNVRGVESPKRPGEGGAADSFDVLVGPRTDGKILGGEISMCLMEPCPARFGWQILSLCLKSADSVKGILGRAFQALI